MKLEAVIFDFDGVIADTMRDNFKAWEKAFAGYGVQIAEVDYFLLEGMGRFEIAEFFVQRSGLDKALIGTLVQKKESLYKLDNHFRVYDEIPQILRLLKEKHIKLGLVTGASRDRVELTLNKELKDYFNVIITSDEVKNGKPHPEPYLKALEKLACDAANTIVVENAKLGIRSAKAAGCICLAVETTLGKEYLIEADKIYKDHTGILKHFTNYYEHSGNEKAIR